jgi:hypothetical protein
MRKAAQRSAQRLAAGNLTVFGAVLNDVKSGSSTEYYVDYNDKRVSEYHDSKAADTAPRREHASVKVGSNPAGSAARIS